MIKINRTQLDLSKTLELLIELYLHQKPQLDLRHIIHHKLVVEDR